MLPPHWCHRISVAQDFTRKALQSHPKRGSLPGTRPARSRSLGSGPIAPPLAPGGAAGRTSTRGRERDALEARWGPHSEPGPQQRADLQNNSIRRRRPSPTGPGPRVSGAGKRAPRGWPTPPILDHPVPARHPAAPRVRAGDGAGAPPAARRAGHVVLQQPKRPRPLPTGAAPAREAGARTHVPCRWPCRR